MSKFQFLTNYIHELPEATSTEAEFPYSLKPEKREPELTTLIMETGLCIPDELQEFYRFSYGAQLGGYQILSPQEIKSLLSELVEVYGGDWQRRILPFAIARDVGDLIAFDTEKTNGDGLAVLDGFHEFAPCDWQVIGFGLVPWLRKMVHHNFEPFWLGTDECSG